MPGKLNISIPAPCHQNWQDMAVADKGRFCSSCQKHVVDFTTASDRQIAEAFKKESNVCGRFLQSQLERDLVIPKEKSSLWMAASAAVVTFFTLGNNRLTAQSQKEQVTKTTAVSQKSFPGRISGIVVDEMSLPIAGAYIIIKGTKKATVSNSEGRFTIEAATGDILECRFVPFSTESVSINNDTDLMITLKEGDIKAPCVESYRYTTTTTMTGAVMIISQEFHATKRTFFGRIFYSVGNLLR